jgi:UDP-3-O-[3-hydroxymyristoyl] glucosamine N-acyltransferase
MTFSLTFLADRISCNVIGPDIIIEGVKTLKEAQKKDITFYSNPLYHKDLINTKAGACLVKLEDADKVPDGIVKLITQDPTLALAKILEIFYPEEQKEPFISSKTSISDKAILGKGLYIEDFAFIEEGASIGDSVEIGVGSYIGKKVLIGAGTKIGPNVTIINAVVGSNCFIHTGVRIGQDGFGFVKDPSNHNLKKIKQIGKVILEDSVEIGANSTIDRGSLGDTKIGSGTKIDNLVQIGHNVVIGKNSILCGMVGVAGSTTIGDYTMIGGQAGIAGHLTIGNFVQIAASSVVINNLPDKARVGGYPAVKINDWHKTNIILQRMIKKD